MLAHSVANCWGEFSKERFDIMQDCNRHFGAEVIKVEPPSTGDPLRVWRELDIDGTSPWFRSLARNKKSIAIDMRKQEGREYVEVQGSVLSISYPFTES